MEVRGRPDNHHHHQASPHLLTQRRETTGDDQREYLWNTPDGKKPDFSETYTYGDEILVSWNALDSSINDLYDLWLTSWQVGPNSVTKCLQSKFEKPNPAYPAGYSSGGTG